MASRKHLSTVGEGEARRPARKRKKTVAQAAESGSHRDLLEAMRDRIAKTVSDASCPPRDLAALTRRLADIAKELDALDLREKQEAKENADCDADSTEEWDEEAL